MRRRWSKAGPALLIPLLATLLASCGQRVADSGNSALDAQATTQSDPQSWPMGGQNYRNTRANTTQTGTNVNNVGKLKLRWKLTTGGDVSATPAVVGSAIYFPDWAGFMYKVDARSGVTLWKILLPTDSGVQAVARTSG